MSSQGPSPLVPSLMVGVLGWVIFGPSVSIMDYALMVLVVLLLLLLVQLLSTDFPTPRLRIGIFQQTSSSAGSDD
ncbi:hypothetical protein Goshw_014991, partial [Gossypium schwendimanii]|nr:hypothetical protein [Gossypium schwendimanii]